MICSTCCSGPSGADDRRRLPPDHEQQHDLGRDGVHARFGVLKGHLFRSAGTYKTAKRHQRYRCAPSRLSFGPQGVPLHPAVLIFLKLKDIGSNVLPPYDGEFREVRWTWRKLRPTAIWRVG